MKLVQTKFANCTLEVFAYVSGLPALSSSIFLLTSWRDNSTPFTEPTILGSPKNFEPPDLNKSPSKNAKSATNTTTINKPERCLMRSIVAITMQLLWWVCEYKILSQLNGLYKHLFEPIGRSFFYDK